MKVVNSTTVGSLLVKMNTFTV